MEVDQNPTRHVTPGPNDRCRRCDHPLSEHIGDTPSDATVCRVELTKSSVPSLDFGGRCPCPSFVFDPPIESTDLVADMLDGPAMYAEALGYLRLARTATHPHTEQQALMRASTYFAGASAFAMGVLSADNGVGDIIERRWLAALTGADTLPEEDATA